MNAIRSAIASRPASGCDRLQSRPRRGVVGLQRLRDIVRIPGTAAGYKTQRQMGRCGGRRPDEPTAAGRLWSCIGCRWKLVAPAEECGGFCSVSARRDGTRRHPVAPAAHVLRPRVQRPRRQAALALLVGVVCAAAYGRRWRITDHCRQNHLGGGALRHEAVTGNEAVLNVIDLSTASIQLSSLGFVRPDSWSTGALASRGVFRMICHLPVGELAGRLDLAAITEMLGSPAASCSSGCRRESHCP